MPSIFSFPAALPPLPAADHRGYKIWTCLFINALRVEPVDVLFVSVQVTHVLGQGHSWDVCIL